MKVIITFLTLLLCTTSFCQKKAKKKTYDYLTGFDRWKLILNSNNTFVLTTNDLFWADTTVLIIGGWINHDTTIQFIVDTTKLEDKDLLRGKFTNEQLITQGDKLPSFENFISFKNALRRVHYESSFSGTMYGSYYRGDGKWTNLITLNKDSTYKILESVHGDEEYTETGNWSYKNGFILFTPNHKNAKWLNKYSDNRKYYVTTDFLIGHLTSKNKSNETYFYFSKAPSDY